MQTEEKTMSIRNTLQCSWADRIAIEKERKDPLKKGRSETARGSDLEKNGTLPY